MALRRMLRAGARVACLAALALAVAGLSACGGDEQPATAASAAAPSIPATLEAARAAFAAGDRGALCDRLSGKAKLVIGLAQHGSLPLDCREDVDRYVGALQAYPNGGTPQLVAIDRPAPDRAVAVYALPDDMRATIPLSRDRAGEWKLDGLFDASLSRIQVRSTSPNPRLPREGELRYAVRVPPIPDAERQSLIGHRVRVSLQTPFGFTPFAECKVAFQLQLGAGGQARVADFRIAGDSPCLDIFACLDKRQRIIPWRASARPAGGGGLRLRAEVCLDSCIGLARGGWELDLVPSPAGWRARSAGMIGTSGWRIDGTFEAGSTARRER